MAFRVFISIIILACAYFAFETVRLSLLQRSLLNAESTHSLGNPDGDLVFVTFFDYSCAECRAGFPVIEAAVERDGNVKFIPRPLSFLDDQTPLILYAAAKQGKFAEMHAALLENYRVVNDQVIEDLADNIGADSAQLITDMQSKDVQKLADKNSKLFTKYRLRSTPAYAVGKDILFASNATLSTNDFVTLFQEARER